MPGPKRLAYRGDPEIKAECLRRVRHILRDRDQARFEAELGIPAELTRLEDAVSVGLDDDEARGLLGRFLAAIPVGADLGAVASRFTHWVLTSPEIDLAGRAGDATKATIARVAGLYERRLAGDEPAEEEWDAAWEATEATAWDSARSAARGAVWEVAQDAAWDSPRDDARSQMAAKLLELLGEAPVPA